MRYEVMVENLKNQDLPAYEVTIQVTTCENRFEVILKPGQKLTSWDTWVLQGKLSKWIQSRMDSWVDGGHNPPKPQE